MGAFTDFYRPIGSTLQIAASNPNATNDALNEFARANRERKQQEQQLADRAATRALEEKRINAEIAAQKARQEIENEKLTRKKKADSIKATINKELSNAGELPPGTIEGATYKALVNAGLSDEAEDYMAPVAKRAQEQYKLNPGAATREAMNTNPALNNYMLSGNRMEAPAPTVDFKGTPASGVIKTTTPSTGEYGDPTMEVVSRPLRETTPFNVGPGSALISQDGKVIYRNPMASGGGGGGGGGSSLDFRRVAQANMIYEKGKAKIADLEAKAIAAESDNPDDAMKQMVASSMNKPQEAVTREDLKRAAAGYRQQAQAMRDDFNFNAAKQILMQSYSERGIDITSAGRPTGGNLSDYYPQVGAPEPAPTPAPGGVPIPQPPAVPVPATAPVTTKAITSMEALGIKSRRKEEPAPRRSGVHVRER